MTFPSREKWAYAREELEQAAKHADFVSMPGHGSEAADIADERQAIEAITHAAQALGVMRLDMRRLVESREHPPKPTPNREWTETMPTLKTEEERIAWIDQQSYETLLRHWRNAPVGDPMFQGDVGEHYASVLAKKRDETPDGGVGASKRIGWDGS